MALRLGHEGAASAVRHRHACSASRRWTTTRSWSCGSPTSARRRCARSSRGWNQRRRNRETRDRRDILLCVLATRGLMNQRLGLRRGRVRRADRVFRLPVVVQPGARGEAAARRGGGCAVGARRRNRHRAHRAAGAAAAATSPTICASTLAPTRSVARRARSASPPAGSRSRQRRRAFRRRAGVRRVRDRGARLPGGGADQPRPRERPFDGRHARRERQPGEAERRVGDYRGGVEGAAGRTLADRRHHGRRSIACTTKCFFTVRPSGSLTGAAIDTSFARTPSAR